MANPIRRSLDVTGRLQGSINPRNKWDIAYAQAVTSGKFKPHRSNLAKVLDITGKGYSEVPFEFMSQLIKSKKMWSGFKKDIENKLFIPISSNVQYDFKLTNGRLVAERDA